MRRFYPKDVLVIGVLLILIGLTWLFINHQHSQNLFLPYNPSPPTIISKIQALPKSPNETKLQFDYAYSSNNVGYEVEQGNSDLDNNATTNQSYYVTYTNLTLSPITTDSSSLNIGCVLANNQNYRSNAGIFDGSLDRPLTFQPFYSPLTMTINVPGSCQYLGTANGQYYWPII